MRHLYPVSHVSAEPPHGSLAGLCPVSAGSLPVSAPVYARSFPHIYAGLCQSSAQCPSSYCRVLHGLAVPLRRLCTVSARSLPSRCAVCAQDGPSFCSLSTPSLTDLCPISSPFLPGVYTASAQSLPGRSWTPPQRSFFPVSTPSLHSPCVCVAWCASCGVVHDSLQSAQTRHTPTNKKKNSVQQTNSNT